MKNNLTTIFLRDILITDEYDIFITNEISKYFQQQTQLKFFYVRIFHHNFNYISKNASHFLIIERKVPTQSITLSNTTD